MYTDSGEHSRRSGHVIKTGGSLPAESTSKGILQTLEGTVGEERDVCLDPALTLVKAPAGAAAAPSALLTKQSTSPPCAPTPHTWYVPELTLLKPPTIVGGEQMPVLYVKGSPQHATCVSPSALTPHEKKSPLQT
jgi:hypothetical protein